MKSSPVARSLFVLACATLSFGCARKHRRPVAHGDPPVARVDEVVKWDAELSEDSPGLVAAFVDRAQHYGCEILKHDDDAAVASCDGVKIAMAKSSRIVSVGCRGVTLEECRALFRRVVESRDAEGTSPPPPAAPPPSEPPPVGTSI